MEESSHGDLGLHASQASSHFPLEPVTGATLYRLEVARRQALGRRGTLPTGCPELDDQVLLQGGFERGTVVGLSAEAMEMALLVRTLASRTRTAGTREPTRISYAYLRCVPAC